MDSPFFIYDINDTRNLTIYRFKLTNDLIVDNIGISYGQNDFLIKEYGKQKTDLLFQSVKSGK